MLLSHGCNDDKLRTPYDSVNTEGDKNSSVTIPEQPHTVIPVCTEALVFRGTAGHHYPYTTDPGIWWSGRSYPVAVGFLYAFENPDLISHVLWFLELIRVVCHDSPCWQ